MYRESLPNTRVGRGILVHMSDYLTTGQAAKQLGISIDSLQQWAKDGLVTPAFTTPGGRYRWAINELLAQLGANAAAVRPPEAIVPAPVVLAVITSRDGVAIGKRTEPPPPWSFIGGAEIEDGENAEQTAIRAAREDAGLQVKAGANLGQRLHPATKRLVTYIACTPATKGEHPLTPGDPFRFSEMHWASLSQAQELMPDMDPRALAHLSRVMRRR
jgi:ADP-ribose pyrophosphatase YjhB (NUDIX family)